MLLDVDVGPDMLVGINKKFTADLQRLFIS